MLVVTSQSAPLSRKRSQLVFVAVVAVGLLSASAATAATQATLTSPQNGSVLSGSTVTFTWDPGSGVSMYWLDVGTIVGQGNLYASGYITDGSTSRTVTNLPTDGSPIYVQLWSNIDGIWTPLRYSFTSGAATPAPAMLASPAGFSTLPGSQVTFSWTPGTLIDQYWLYVGTSMGAADIYNSGAIVDGSTSRTVSGIPTDGRAIYALMWSHTTTGVWVSIIYSFTAASIPAAAQLTSPASGSILPGAQVLFSWTPGTLIDQYWLYVGNSPGAGDIYNSGAIIDGSTSRTVSGIPTDGRAIYAVMWSHAATGAWGSIVYSFTAATTNQIPVAAQLTSPANGTILPGAQVLFSWTPGTLIDQYWLYVGNGPVAADIYNSGAIVDGSTSRTVSGIPADGRAIYVTLWSHAASGWLSLQYVFTAASSTVAISACREITTSGAYALASDLSSAAAAPCLSIHDVQSVTLLCNQHAVASPSSTTGAIAVQNATNISIQGCTISSSSGFAVAITQSANVSLSSSTLTGLTATNLSAGTFSGNHVDVNQSRGIAMTQSDHVAITGNTIAYQASGIINALIDLEGGHDNQMALNVLDGGWDGGLNLIGADDGVFLRNESNDTVTNNDIVNIWDAGLETFGTLTNTTISSNRFRTCRIGVGGWYDLGWQGNTISGNSANAVSALFYVTGISNSGGAMFLRDNTFSGNVLTSWVNRPVGFSSPAAATISGLPIGPGGGVVDASNNRLSGNDFTAASILPVLQPASAIVDGGGNRCGTAPPGYPIVCGQ